jgi:flagellar hook protein FlgE
VTSTTGQIASGIITFSSTGAVASSTLPTSLSIPWSTDSGLGTQTVALNLTGTSGGLTQQASASTVNSISTDGGPAGTLTGVAVGNDGKVTANFSNGASRVIAQVAVATFTNPDGLAGVSGNAYAQTAQSGDVVLKAPQTGGAGEIESSQLEASTVDLSTEFTNLIITQRAYSAASKIITTADQMLQELISVKQ